MGIKFKQWVLLLLVTTIAIFSCQAPGTITAQPTSPVVNSALIEAPLVPLSQPGPWPEVSHLISYGDRLWFANSTFFGNHNSADIYSYDPQTATTRLEQHLFSQSTGEPVVVDDLLYWPFEDPRFSADLGEYMVTNGQDWQWHLLPEGEAFHVHSMASHGGELWASTGAWSGGVQRSSDAGKTWELVYTYPTPPQRVSRVTHLQSLNDDQLFAEVMAVHERSSKVLQWQTNGFEPVTTWPQGKRVKAMTAFQGHVYGVNQNLDDTVSVWRTDGEQSTLITTLEGHQIRAFAATKTTLWAISAERGQGYLWQSNDGLTWTATQHFTDLRPLDISVHGDQVYVGGRNSEGQGVLWGPSQPGTNPSATQPPVPLPRPAPLPVPPSSSPTATTATQLESLSTVLANQNTYTQGNTQDLLAKTLAPLAMASDPAIGQQLSTYLNQPLPVQTAQLFGGKVSAPATEVVQWYLLWAMGLNGHGQVPLTLLKRPWNRPANDREKYWHPAPAAAWAAAQLGQDDPATITTMVERLATQSDPLWLVGDFVGALHQLTGEQYGYDIAAWQRWVKARNVSVLDTEATEGHLQQNRNLLNLFAGHH